MNATVEIEQGRLRGQSGPQALSFRGVAYAAPTGGRNRFLAPQPAPHWSGVRDAFAHGDRCPQTVDNIGELPLFGWYGQEGAFSEHCCVLNVFTPGLQAAARRPVIVYIHGGGYSNGGSGGAALEGGRLAAFGDVVVVTLNHRLNIFGYTAFDPTDDPALADAAHAGQLDLVAALRWVRRNIAAFGGDPGNVTLMGQSGGGNKIMTLLVMPQARGLFRRAINMSGTSGLRLAPPQDAQPYVQALLQALGLRRADLARLQVLTADALQQARRQAIAAARHDGAHPVVDGHCVAASPFSAEGLALHADVPLMIGSTGSEATLYLGQDPRNRAVDDDELLDRIQAQFALERPRAAALVAAYRDGAGLHAATDVLAQLASDMLARGHLLQAAEAKAAAGGAPVYVYNLGWRIRAEGGHWGSPHTVDIPFAFGTLDSARSMTAPHADEAEDVSRRLMGAVVSFARHGDPWHEGLPAWPAYDVQQRATMVFDTPCHLSPDHGGVGRVACAPLLPWPPAALLRGPLLRGLR